MFYKSFIILSIFTVSLFSENLSSQLKLEKAVMQEETAIDTLGMKSTKLKPVKMVQSGTVLVYLNRLYNGSRQVKHDLLVVNPIPNKTTYIRGSASCEGFCKILFSIDGGKTFDYGENLFVRYGSKKRMAMGSEYTHIKFMFHSLMPFSRTKMAFKSRVK